MPASPHILLPQSPPAPRSCLSPRPPHQAHQPATNHPVALASRVAVRASGAALLWLVAACSTPQPREDLASVTRLILAPTQAAEQVASYPLRSPAAPAAMQPKAMPTAQTERRPDPTAASDFERALAEAVANQTRKLRAQQAQAVVSAAPPALVTPAASGASPAAATTGPAWIAWNTPPRMRLGDSAQSRGAPASG